MRRAIATVSLSGSLKEKIEAVAAAHFDAVEIFENDLLFSREDEDVIGRENYCRRANSRYALPAFLGTYVRVLPCLRDSL